MQPAGRSSRAPLVKGGSRGVAAAAAAARPPPLQVRLLAAEFAALVGFSPRLICSPVCSVVVVGWLVVGAVRGDLVGALVGASVAAFLVRIFGL